MSFTAGTTLSAAALNAATASPGAWSTLTTTPAGTCRYRTAGPFVEVIVVTTTVLVSGTEYTLCTLPSGVWPGYPVAMASNATTTGTRATNATIGTDGTIKARNNYGTDSVVILHALYLLP